MLEEIKDKLNLDLASRPDILRQVSNNDRIQCNLPFLQYRVINEDYDNHMIHIIFSHCLIFVTRKNCLCILKNIPSFLVSIQIR